MELPVEFIELTPINPLISKCQIKVCYVDDEPNRNRSVITKEVARKMANSLPGSPIVGYYNENKQDFEEHNMDPDDVDMLQDMIIAAINEAMRTADAEAAQNMSRLTGGINLGGLF